MSTRALMHQLAQCSSSINNCSLLCSAINHHLYLGPPRSHSSSSSATPDCRQFATTPFAHNQHQHQHQPFSVIMQGGEGLPPNPFGGRGPQPRHSPSPLLFSEVPPVVLSPHPCRVVVIGWMGSRARYMRKYTGLWERTGDNAVLTIRPSITQTLVRFKGIVQAGADIDKVARLHIENGGMPTFYHIFSTGGFIHAGTMWRWMDEVEDEMLRRDMLEEVAGIIIDSGPCKIDDKLAARAVVSALSGSPVAADTLTRSGGGGASASDSAGGQRYGGVLAGALLPPIEAFFKMWLGMRGPKLRELEVYDAWQYRAPTCPQLYLYSDADPLADPADIEEFIQSQESRGVEVTRHVFQGSGHCEHYRRYPQEYALQVSQFVSKALERW